MQYLKLSVALNFINTKHLSTIIDKKLSILSMFTILYFNFSFQTFSKKNDIISIEHLFLFNEANLNGFLVA